MNKKAKFFAEPVWVAISIVAIIVVGMFVQKSYDIFAITGNEVITRDLPTSAKPTETFIAEYYPQSVSGTWGATIEETITGGCIYKATGLNTLKTVMLNSDDDPLIKEILAPSVETECVFTGNYQFGNRSIKSLTTKTVVITSSSTCSSGQKQCISNTQYKTCLANGQWSGTLTCASGTICDNGNCVTDDGDDCNTEADTDCDGEVSRTELGTAIEDWINGDLTRDKLGEIIVAWIN